VPIESSEPAPVSQPVTEPLLELRSGRARPWAWHAQVVQCLCFGGLTAGET